MATFRITFKNRLGIDGEPMDIPPDKLNANGARIESYGYVTREIRQGEGFARDTWEYEIADKDNGRFIEGLRSTSVVMDYKKL